MANPDKSLKEAFPKYDFSWLPEAEKQAFVDCIHKNLQGKDKKVAKRFKQSLATHIKTKYAHMCIVDNLPAPENNESDETTQDTSSEDNNSTDNTSAPNTQNPSTGNSPATTNNDNKEEKEDEEFESGFSINFFDLYTFEGKFPTPEELAKIKKSGKVVDFLKKHKTFYKIIQKAKWNAELKGEHIQVSMEHDDLYELFKGEELKFENDFKKFNKAVEKSLSPINATIPYVRLGVKVSGEASAKFKSKIVIQIPLSKEAAFQLNTESSVNMEGNATLNVDINVQDKLKLVQGSVIVSPSLNLNAGATLKNTGMKLGANISADVSLKTEVKLQIGPGDNAKDFIEWLGKDADDYTYDLKLGEVELASVKYSYDFPGKNLALNPSSKDVNNWGEFAIKYKMMEQDRKMIDKLKEAGKDPKDFKSRAAIKEAYEGIMNGDGDGNGSNGDNLECKGEGECIITKQKDGGDTLDGTPIILKADIVRTNEKLPELKNWLEDKTNKKSFAMPIWIVAPNGNRYITSGIFTKEKTTDKTVIFFATIDSKTKILRLENSPKDWIEIDTSKSKFKFVYTRK